jgi:uncharacterized protein (TIGR00369 family)
MQAWTLEQVQEELKESGMVRFMQLQCTHWDATVRCLTLEMPYRDELQGGAGIGHFHGGAIGALIDTAATYAVLASGAPHAPTANYRIDLLRPVANGATAVAVAMVKRIGRTLALVDVELSAQDKLCALGRVTFVVA